MDMLLAAAPMDRGHVTHPEMVSIGTQRVNGLLETDFNFEAPSVNVSGGVKLDENRRFEIPGGFLVLKQRTGSFDCRFGAMVDVNR